MTTIWIFVLIAAVIIEVLTPSALVSIWFAVGSACAWIAAKCGLTLWPQIWLFLGVSGICLIIARPKAVDYLRGNIIPTNSDRLIGETATITKPITQDKWGELKVRNAVWSAVELNGKPVEAGKKVKIMAIEGAKLIVKEIEV
ncbi:MAG: NfeD family protein [Faecalicoccus sp.]|nr:NfeD family protein [Faecalicoccus sp.]